MSTKVETEAETNPLSLPLKQCPFCGHEGYKQAYQCNNSDCKEVWAHLEQSCKGCLISWPVRMVDPKYAKIKYSEPCNVRTKPARDQKEKERAEADKASIAKYDEWRKIDRRTTFLFIAGPFIVFGVFIAILTWAVPAAKVPTTGTSAPVKEAAP